MRYVQVRVQGCILVCDTKHTPYRVVCQCDGWNRRQDADLIVAALTEYNVKFFDQFIIGGENDGEGTA